MKSAICLLMFCCAQLGVQAQSAPEGEAPSPAEAQAQAAAKAMVQRLFAQESSEESMLAMAKEAGRAGIPRQQVIEAKLVWGLRHQNAWATSG